MIVEKKVVFSKSTGGPGEFYRIPAMVTTKNGVVVACADARLYVPHDNPNRIDQYVRRSTDCGETWGEYIPVMTGVGTEPMKSVAYCDPILTYSPETGRLFLHCIQSPSGVGIKKCYRCVGEDAEGNRIIHGGHGVFTLKNGWLYRDGVPSPYRVYENGDVYTDLTVKVGNIYNGEDFREEDTFYLTMSYSDDDGLTWSAPRSINYQVKEEYMSSLGPGPGNGIVLKNGKYKGRIVVTVYFGTTTTVPLRLSCCVIYSDDNGETWKRGETPNNIRMIGGEKACCMTIRDEDCLSEAQVIEQEDGTLKMFMRNHDARRCVAVAYSRDGGATWEDFSYDENLPFPICQTSVIKLENTDKPYVVLLNPADQKERKCGTVRLSEDDGETFPYSRVLNEGSHCYSSLTQLPDGKIGALIEADPECREMYFTKFSLEWIKGLE